MSLEGLQIGNYQITRRISAGGMGTVYLAEDSRIRRPVAIKAYQITTQDQEAERRFQREITAIMALDHPNILPIFDFGTELVNNTTYSYLVMPYRSDGSLSNWQQRHGAQVASQEVASLVTQIADALQYAHEQQVIHQNVKPSNIMVLSQQGGSPTFQLTDFRLARFTSSPTGEPVREMSLYRAPEQYSNGPASAATDQYALASIAYQLLTGRPPFSGQASQFVQQVLTATPAAPSSFNPQFSSVADRVMLRALAKRPEDRFVTINDFARALQAELTKIKTGAGSPKVSTGEDIRATLTISTEEAQNGTTRTLGLPGGRKATVNVPAQAFNGQVLKLSGLGEAAYDGGPRGSLILTLSVQEASRPTSSGTALASPTVMSSFSSSSSPQYAPGSASSGSIPYPAVSASGSMYPAGSSADLSMAPPPPPQKVVLPSSQQVSDPNIYSPYHPSSQTYPQEAQVSYPREETVRASLPAAPNMSGGPSVYGGLNPAPPMYGAPNNMGLAGYPPVPPPTPPRQAGVGLGLKIAAVVMVVLLIGLGVTGVLFFQNQQHQKDVQATATATTKNSTAVAIANQATATALTASNNAAATATVTSGNATATATVLAAHPYPTYIQGGSNPLVLYDPLQNNNNGYSWSEGDNCKFDGQSYHAIQTELNKSHYCFVKFQEFSSFTMEVQMKVTKGDCGGIFFRSNTAFTDFYAFFVCTNGNYGLYHFFSGTFHHLTGPNNNSFSSVIRQGTGSNNTLAVAARGGTYDLYVNQTKIDSASDGGSSTGYSGLAVEADNGPTEVIYTQTTIWAPAS